MYEQWVTYFDGLTIRAMDNVIAGGIAFTLSYLRGAMMLLVLIAAVLMLRGDMTVSWGVRKIILGLIVLALLQVGNYNAVIREPFWTTIPNGIASALNGGPVSITAAQRFNSIAQAIEHVVALADQRIGNPFWNIRASMSVSIVQLFLHLFLAFVFAVWQVARVATALIISAGPFLLIAALFETSRQYVFDWFGKLISVSALTLYSWVMTEIALAGGMTWIQQRFTADNGMSATISDLLSLCAWFFICSLIMVGLPMLASIGGSGGAGVATSVGAGLAGGKAASGAAVSGTASAARMGAAIGASIKRSMGRGGR